MVLKDSAVSVLYGRAINQIALLKIDICVKAHPLFAIKQINCSMLPLPAAWRPKGYWAACVFVSDAVFYPCPPAPSLPTPTPNSHSYPPFPPMQLFLVRTTSVVTARPPRATSCILNQTPLC